MNRVAARAGLAAFTCAALMALCSGCAHAPPPPDSSLVVRAPAGSQLFVDDVYFGLVRPEPLPLRSGLHRVEVRAQGRLSAFRDVTLRPGQQSALEVTLRPDIDALDAAGAP